MKKLVIVAISKDPYPGVEKYWRDRGFSVHWRVNNFTVDPENSIRRVSEVALERNLAMKETLEIFPDATDIFMVDSYYAVQFDSCHRLISDYQACPDKVIVSGAIWGETRTRIHHIIRSRKWFLDTWGFPDCRFMPYGFRPDKERVVWGDKAIVPIKGFYRVDSVGSAYLFPVEAWLNTPYKPCFDLSRTEHYYLCRNSGFICYVDFNAPFFRKGRWLSLTTCFKNSIGDIIY